jgi:hypothetical protein
MMAQRHKGTKAQRYSGTIRLSALLSECLSVLKTTPLLTFLRGNSLSLRPFVAWSVCACASICLFGLSSCDAPRHNPLDPQNPDNHYHYIQGTILTLSIPHYPISGVSVSWAGQSLPTQTGAQGTFQLETIDPPDGWVYLRHDEYCADSVYVSWQNRTTVSITRYLNAIPEIDSLQIYSIILNRYPNLQTEQVTVRVKIDDPDHDIDSVLANNSYSSSRFPLSYNTNDKWYEKILSLYDLQISNLEEIVGHPFEILVVDIFGRIVIPGAGDVKRILREEVNFISPSGNEVTPPQPALNWQKYLPGFNFSLLVQIFTAEIIPQLVWEKNQITAETVAYTVDQALPAGEYFWVIWAIDDFGNRTRSKPASFKVE